jgi:hypothetical protein
VTFHRSLTLRRFPASDLHMAANISTNGISGRLPTRLRALCQAWHNLERILHQISAAHHHVLLLKVDQPACRALCIVCTLCTCFQLGVPGSFCPIMAISAQRMVTARGHAQWPDQPKKETLRRKAPIPSNSSSKSPSQGWGQAVRCQKKQSVCVVNAKPIH